MTSLELRSLATKDAFSHGHLFDLLILGRRFVLEVKLHGLHQILRSLFARLSKTRDIDIEALGNVVFSFAMDAVLNFPAHFSENESPVPPYRDSGSPPSQNPHPAVLELAGVVTWKL